MERTLLFTSFPWKTASKRWEKWMAREKRWRWSMFLHITWILQPNAQLGPAPNPQQALLLFRPTKKQAKLLIFSRVCNFATSISTTYNLKSNNHGTEKSMRNKLSIFRWQSFFKKIFTLTFFSNFDIAT